jgi:hypothetical protein
VKLRFITETPSIQTTWQVRHKRIASVQQVKCREHTIVRAARVTIARQKASKAMAILHHLRVQEVAKAKVIANVRTIANRMTMA